MVTMAYLAEKSPFSIERSFSAPIDLVFRMWTDSNHLKRWLAPTGSSLAYIKADIRPGGVSHYCMSTLQNATTMWGKAAYQIVEPPKRLVYLQYFSDENEGITRHPMSSLWPLEMQTTVRFEELSGRTGITLEWLPLHATPEEWAAFTASHVGIAQGWIEAFEKLDTYLASAALPSTGASK